MLDPVKWARPSITRATIVDAQRIDMESLQHQLENWKPGQVIAVDGSPKSCFSTFDFLVRVRSTRFASHVPRGVR
jgi:hypothetical protein